MPQTYKNKQNIVTQWDECKACGRTSRLESFDATTGGRSMHILRYCANCREPESRMSDAQWQQTRQQARAAAQAAATQRGNRDLAFHALNAVADAHDEEAFAQLAAVLETHYANDFGVMAMLGHAYTTFEMPEAADAAFTRALALSNNNAEVFVSRATNRLYQGWVDDAAPDARRIVASQHPDRVRVGQLLAEAYQVHGRHDEALEALDDLTARAPHLRTHEYVQQLRRASEANRKSGKPAGAWQLPGRRYTPPKKTTSRKQLAVVAMVIAGLFGIFVWASAASTPDHVYLVGGGDTTYKVRINGKEYVVPVKGSHTQVEVDWGEIRVESIPGDRDVGNTTYNLDSALLGRLFDERTLVINPDQQAKVIWAEIEYVDPSMVSFASQPNTRTHHSGVFHLFRDVDYHFTPFPDEVYIESNREKRSGVFCEDQFMGLP